MRSFGKLPRPSKRTKNGIGKKKRDASQRPAEVTGRENRLVPPSLPPSAHCLSSRGFSPSGFVRVPRKFPRENAPQFFYTVRSFPCQAESCVRFANLREVEPDSSHRGKELRARVDEHVLRWSDNFACDRCPQVHTRACIGVALPQPPARKHGKGPRHC